MAGLLDFEDPRTMGLLNAGLGIMAQAGDTSRQFGLGQALASGLGTMQQTQLQAEMLKRQKAQEDLQMQMKTLQADEIKRRYAMDNAIRNEYKNAYTPDGLNLASLPNKLMGIGAFDEGLALQKQLRGENYKLGKDESLFSPDNKLIATGATTAPKRELKEGYITQDENGNWVIDKTLYEAHVKAKKAGATSVNVNKDNLGLTPSDRFNMEGKLSDDYRGETKTDQGVLSAVSKIKTSLSKPGALADQSAIYSFAKMLDPEGAVRESDYAAVMNTAGLEDRVKNYIQKMQTGEMLSPNQRKEMLDVMSRFEQVASSKIANVKNNYSERARSYNLAPEKLFMDAKKEVAAPAQKTVVRTGMYNGRKVVEYSDGSVGYGN